MRSLNFTASSIPFLVFKLNINYKNAAIYMIAVSPSPYVAQYLAVHRQLDSRHGDDTSDKGTGERGVAYCHGNYEGVTVSYDDVRLALRAVRPSAMREVAIEVPKVRRNYCITRKFLH